MSNRYLELQESIYSLTSKKRELSQAKHDYRLVLKKWNKEINIENRQLVENIKRDFSIFIIKEIKIIDTSTEYYFVKHPIFKYCDYIHINDVDPPINNMLSLRLNFIYLDTYEEEIIFGTIREKDEVHLKIIEFFNYVNQGI